MNSATELDATYCGFVGSTYDALILFEACITGQIKHVSHRPHDRERRNMIQSGRVFIYEENTSGIKRWTDGISWSPSRILGNFLIYRQLVKAFGPGEKKKAIKKSKPGQSGGPRNGQDKGNSGRNKNNDFQGVGNLQTAGGAYGRAGKINAETERALIGSLTDSYDFLEGGLVKKTISVTCNDLTHHLVSYYTILDVISQKFLVPSKDPRFAQTHPRLSLLTSQSFRNPIEDINPIGRLLHPRNRYDIFNQSLQQRQIPLLASPESHPSHYGKAVSIYNSNNAMPITSTTYERSFAYNLTFGYQIHRTPNSDYDLATQRPHQYQVDCKQDFSEGSCSNINGRCVSIPTSPNGQREDSVFHWKDSDSEDSSVSMCMGNIIKDPTYSHIHSIFYGTPRNVTLPGNYAVAQKAPSGSSPTDFSYEAPFQWPPFSEQKDRITKALSNLDTRQIGNVGVGHGHYRDA